MSDMYSFVGNWGIGHVGGEVVWPFQLNRLVAIGKPAPDDTLPVEVIDPAGVSLGRYQGVYSEPTGGLKQLSISGVEYNGAVYTLAMTVLTPGPHAEEHPLLQGNWFPTGSTLTKGTWVGNEGGIPLPYDQDRRPAHLTSTAA